MHDRLTEIRARLDAATPGPWLVRNGWVDLNNLHGDVIPVGHNDADADLIAHAPADIAWLLAEVERLERENADDLLEITRKASDAEDYWMQEAKRLAAGVERLRGLAACPDCDYMDGGKPCVYCAAAHKKGAA